MTILRNEQGRSYVQCDGPEGVQGPLLCGANIIDLSGRLDEAARCARTFFGWSTSMTARGWIARCPRCRAPEPRRQRGGAHYSGGFRRSYVNGKGLNNASRT